MLLGLSKTDAMRMSLTEAEFTVLRQTIAARGTTRIVLLPVTVLAWAALATVLVIFPPLPVAVLFPLAILVAGFEAIHALHVGAERIGRYLQVFYEDDPEGPRWEHTAMAVGPALPGGGIDPLFTVVFVLVTIINVLPSLLPRPLPVELAVVGTLHVAFLLRLIRARGAAARQRAVELESFRALRTKASDIKP
jgi:hypothetical protein